MELCVGGDPVVDLPGFRFHPTEQELIEYYLSRVAHGKPLKSEIIRLLDIYKYDPWELPGMAVGEREWYFFVRRDRRNKGRGRPSRTTERGYWKATGSDRRVLHVAEPEPRRLIGIKKTLVFYRGRAPQGAKTDWVMNEYRLPDISPQAQEDIVLCKIYRKAVSLKELEQRAALEQVNQVSLDEASFSTNASDDQENSVMESNGWNQTVVSESTSVNVPHMELQIPDYSFDLIHDTLFFQLCSPWLDQGSPLPNLLDF